MSTGVFTSVVSDSRKTRCRVSSASPLAAVSAASAVCTPHSPSALHAGRVPGRCYTHPWPSPAPPRTATPPCTAALPPYAVEPGIANAVFPARLGEETTRDGILRNLRLLRGRVKPLGVPFTIDVFGFTASAETPMPIGQVWEDLVSTADVVLPMVYPSHYRHAFHGIDDPNAEPYRVVHLALEDGMARAARIAAPAEIRPYLQAFTQGAPPYTPQLVRDQIRAAEELGIRSWALWNAESVYPPAIFRPKRRHSPPCACLNPA